MTILDFIKITNSSSNSKLYNSQLKTKTVSDYARTSYSYKHITLIAKLAIVMYSVPLLTYFNISYDTKDDALQTIHLLCTPVLDFVLRDRYWEGHILTTLDRRSWSY